MGRRIAPGDEVILFFPPRERGEARTFLRRVEGEAFHTKEGVIRWSDVVGRPYGSRLATHTGKAFYVLEPTVLDYAYHLRRRTQILYPKDLAYIAARLDLVPGRVLLECGTGSGSSAIFFAARVRPDGKVISYEARPEFQELARENLRRAGLLDWVDLRLGRAEEGFDVEEADAVFLDLPEPWVALPAARAALKDGGPLACLLPTFGQVERMLAALREHRFFALELEELLLRPYRPYPGRVRPADRMVAHTGYLIFARKEADG